MGAPPDACPSADHVGEGGRCGAGILDDSVDLLVAGIGDAETLDDEVGVNPVAKSFLVGIGAGRLKMLAEAEGKIFG